MKNYILQEWKLILKGILSFRFNSHFTLFSYLELGGYILKKKICDAATLWLCIHKCNTKRSFFSELLPCLPQPDFHYYKTCLAFHPLLPLTLIRRGLRLTQLWGWCLKIWYLLYLNYVLLVITDIENLFKIIWERIKKGPKGPSQVFHFLTSIENCE